MLRLAGRRRRCPGGNTLLGAMRILILHSQYQSGPVSGENRVVEDEARLLKEAGHDVHVWDPASSASSALDLLRAGVRYGRAAPPLKFGR
jgi:hypothetical protein